MTTVLDEDLVTITEAARLLKVSPSSIRRWVGQGHLPAYRVGQRRVRVKKDDLARLVVPVQEGEEKPLAVDQYGRPIPRRLTDQERQQWLAALEDARRFQAEMLARRGGEPFTPSWILINEARDERTRDLQ